MKEKQANEKRMGGQTEAIHAEKAEWDWAVRAEITDGSRPGDYATREETALMIAAALRYWTGCVFRILNEGMQEGGIHAKGTGSLGNGSAVDAGAN